MDQGDYRKAIQYFIDGNTACPHFKTLEQLGECYLRAALRDLCVMRFSAISATSAINQT